MSQNLPLSLRYLSCLDIKHKPEGLREPSGLALSPQTHTLWTVSDDTKRIFCLDSEGNIQHHQTFAIPVDGLEGIAFEPSGECVLAVKEETNEVLRIRLSDTQVVSRVALRDMANYTTIASFFSGTGSDSSPADTALANKGLEGITWNEASATVFTVKEGYPGLLIELSGTLGTIIGHTLLDKRRGFSAPELASDDIDFSGLCYDRTRNSLWIVSDRAKRLFLFDLATQTVRQSFPLTYSKNGKQRRIVKAEGVVLDPDNNRLYIASDRKAKIYLYEIEA
ncbi:MAG: SdiA-regulated domain-containing protein [Cyanobacteria bacterium J06597_1]